VEGIAGNRTKEYNFGNITDWTSFLNLNETKGKSANYDKALKHAIALAKKRWNEYQKRIHAKLPHASTGSAPYKGSSHAH
jgi:hypothetical protein